MMLYMDFLNHDYPIIGLHPILDDHSCGCGNRDCKMAGKHPYSRSWQSSPVWSDEQVECMEDMGQLSTGYGVLMRGLMVVDVDARNGGVESLQSLLADFPEIQGAGLIVETGSGGGSKHYYFTVPHDMALVSKLSAFPGIDFKTSGYVVGPGSRHQSGREYRVLVGIVEDIAPAPEKLLSALKKPDRMRAEISGRPVDVSTSDIVNMLAHIPADDYEIWIRVGMAIHEVTGGGGFELWDTWSQQSDKYDHKTIDSKWHSFGKSQSVVSFGTLVYHAVEGGYQFPVEFESEELFDEPEESGDLPIDITGIDLLRPPGFVGELAHWIAMHPRRRREYLAVAAAIASVGNIFGLNYIDGADGVTSNLFAFCVAGSGTGKEAIQQAMAEIHKVAGLAPACHGTIKSEQEIMRNIAMRHQAAFYIIDELGVLFQKIKNAMDRGGASYLEGVIGLLMSAYSKANGTMLISGDLREEIKTALSKSIAHQRKLQDAYDDNFCADTLSKLEHQYKSIDSGLINPFVSIAGFTTPETFYSCVDKDNATNGFFGRALIFREHETVPKYRENYTTPVMSESMRNTIMLMAADGRMDMRADGSRVEQTHERIPIPSTPEAVHAMRLIRLWLDDKAEAEKGASGLEAMYLRCYELIAKVAFILACPGGVRELIHVQYAYALIMKDIKHKVDIVLSNDSKNAPERALMAKIRSLIGDEGATEGVLINRTNQRKKEITQKALAYMIETKQLRREEVKAKNKKLTVMYFLL